MTMRPMPETILDDAPLDTALAGVSLEERRRLPETVALLAAAAGLGVCVSLLPFKAIPHISLDLMALAGVVVVRLAVYLGRQRLPNLPVTLVGLCALPFLLQGGWLPGAVAAYLVLLLIEDLAGRVRGQNLRYRRMAFVVAGGLVFGAGVWAGGGGHLLAQAFGLGVSIVSLLTYFGLTYFWLPEPPVKTLSTRGRLERLQTIAHLLAGKEGGFALVCDSLGRIDHALLEQRTSGAAFAGDSLLELVLVSDRVALLQMLAEVATAGNATRKLSLRARLPHGAQGLGAQDGFYREMTLSFSPISLTGVAGRQVLVVIEPPSGARSEADINRIPHDALAPFTAALGMLELLADPTLRDAYAGPDLVLDAREAMRGAYRHARLLADSLRLCEAQGAGLDPVEVILPGVLLKEAIGLVDAGEELLVSRLVLEPGDVRAGRAGPVFRLRPLQTRLALAVLLCEGLDRPGTLRLEWQIEGRDLRLYVRPIPGIGVDLPPARLAPDPFFKAIERASQGVFEPLEGGGRCVCFKDAKAASDEPNLWHLVPKTKGKAA